jgi:hypothetical protein
MVLPQMAKFCDPLMSGEKLTRALPATTVAL